MNNEQNTRRIEIYDRLQSPSKVEQAKHYIEDVSFLLEIIQSQHQEIANLTDKVDEITNGEHERAFNTLNKLTSLLSNEGYLCDMPVG